MKKKREKKGKCQLQYRRQAKHPWADTDGLGMTLAADAKLAKNRNAWR